jgi:hypothetical protein
MKSIIKTFKGVQTFGGGDAIDYFNASNGWLQEFVGPVTDTISGSSTIDTENISLSKWAKSLLGYIRIRGERTELIENSNFACCAYGEKWKTAYLSGHVDCESVCEVVIIIDDDAHAVQFALTDL